jgi:hypothetical protein
LLTLRHQGWSRAALKNSPFFFEQAIAFRRQLSEITTTTGGKPNSLQLYRKGNVRKETAPGGSS